MKDEAKKYVCGDSQSSGAKDLQWNTYEVELNEQSSER